MPLATGNSKSRKAKDKDKDNRKLNQNKGKNVKKAPKTAELPQTPQSPKSPVRSPTQEPDNPPSLIGSPQAMPESMSSTPSVTALSLSQGGPPSPPTSTLAPLPTQAEDQHSDPEEETAPETQPLEEATPAEAEDGGDEAEVNVPGSLDKVLEDSTSPSTSLTQLRQRQSTPSAVNVPLPSPSLSEARLRQSSPAYHYSHPASPALSGSPYYPYPGTLAYPYSQGMVPGSGAYPDPAMASAHQLPTPARSSTVDSACVPSSYNPMQHKRGRPSFSRGYDYYPQYTSARVPTPAQSQTPDTEAAAATSDAETLSLLERIQNVIPDIGRLVASYQETKSQLSARDAAVQQIESQHEETLMKKEFYIEALQTQLRKAAKESAEECSGLKSRINELRLEVGNLQEKQKDVEENLAEAQMANEDLSQIRTELQDEIESLRRTIDEEKEACARELQKQKEREQEALANQKQEMEGYFEVIKAEDDKLAADQLKAREQELMDERDALKAEWEEEKNTLIADYEGRLTAKQDELESKVSEIAEKKSELESKQDELEAMKRAVDAKQAELDEAKQKHADELASMEESFEQARAQAAKKAEDRVNALVSLYQEKDEEAQKSQKDFESQLSRKEEELKKAVQEKEEQSEQFESQLNQKLAELESQLNEKTEELQQVLQAKEELAEKAVTKEEQMQNLIDEMRQTHDNLSRDRDRLKKTLQSLGEATDLKAKGDQFFISSFQELSRLVVELSETHFDNIPIEPPADVIGKVPSELPQFLENTPASREIRSAYVQHVIFKTLTYRIFQPFLFTLGRRYDKADTLFRMLSSDIRRKSVRREAFWRQQTLKAAYTASEAKKSINVVAAVIVDEIVDHIRHFTDPENLDELVKGVRAIVKIAAETWRHARVERELIVATMPAAEDEFVSGEGWIEHQNPQDATSEPPTEDSSKRRILLRLSPRVLREAAHEDFSGENDDDKSTSNCVYLKGTILYADSPAIIARRQEIAKKKSSDPVASAEPLITTPSSPQGQAQHSPDVALTEAEAL